VQSINNDTGQASNSIPFYTTDPPFVYTKNLLTSVKWKAEDGEISAEVDIFPNAAESGWTKGLLTWAKFILRQMSSTAKYRFKSMSIQLPLFFSFYFFFFFMGPVCSVLFCSAKWICLHRRGVLKNMGTWAGANGGLRQVTVPCLHEWELGHMAKKHGRRFSEGVAKRVEAALGWLRLFIFRHIDVSAINIISILLHILFHAMFSLLSRFLFFLRARERLSSTYFWARATSGHSTCQSIWKSLLSVCLVITKK